MDKLGICTFYYNNFNYGASLQAYALQKTIHSFGYEVEMISYYDNNIIHKLLSDLKQIIKRKSTIDEKIKNRRELIAMFNKTIPHSRLYYSNSVKSLNKGYSGFVVGSDQVWNPEWLTKLSSLNYASGDKLTIAYAASTGKIKLDEKQKKMLKTVLQNTKYISIREKESIPVLQELTSKKIDNVLDPTLLLKKSEWDLICQDRLIRDNYMFCYFLGDNQNLRIVAKEYSNRNNLKIVSLPYMNGSHRTVDDDFGDFQLYDISPTDFISLIKYASFVMTDSFHCAVFSHIYERNFIVSGGGKDEMGCRMMSLTNLFGTEKRYIEEHKDVCIDLIERAEEQKVCVDSSEYMYMLQHSLDFLRSALSDGKQNL